VQIVFVKLACVSLATVRLSADTDGLIREEVSRTTTLPSFLTNSALNSQSQSQTTPSTENAKEETDANVPDDIANFYQVKLITGCMNNLG
jgi:hypothetical protein